MSTPGTEDFIAIEKKWVAKWEQNQIHRFHRDSEAPVFSIDTPPPTVSGRMHIGHAFSYTQMDIVARYKRMKGFNVFYPWGFDDNGIATELFVKNETGVDPKDVGREKFIELCLEVSKELEEELVRKWKRIGTFPDYSIFYRTIDERSRRTSQKSFIDLYKMGREYRKEAPTLWCPHCETAISQVETDDLDLEGKFNNIDFELKDGGKLTISTTRPELLAACVAVFVHPEDERNRELVGKTAFVPLFGQEVQILEDPQVDMETGTGIVMCCTFGDQADIDWWYAHGLPLRIAIDETGHLTDVAGDYTGMHIQDARESIIEDLKEEGYLGKRWDIFHAVKVHERCDTPIEFLVTKQWFIKYLDLTDKYLEIGEEIRWFPEHMKVRYDNWVKSLKWDWCISRQRYHGIPFPVWYCKGCGEVKLAAEEQLPVDPLKDSPEGSCKGCGSTEFEPEKDVLDTWTTSSMTPYIATGWIDNDPLFDKIFPFSLRPQSHDIISFWAFNTIAKSLFHSDVKPWDDILIHGYLMLPGGKAFSSSRGIIIDPEEVADEHSGDAIRYLAGMNKPGEDSEFENKWLTRGIRLRTKLWNIQRFIEDILKDKIDSQPELRTVDRWILTRYSEMVNKVTEYMDEYRYDRALKETEYFLWHIFADHYIEMVKHRIYENDPAVKYVMHEVGLGLTKLLAPFMCFATEEIYHRYYKEHYRSQSIHVSPWPEPILVDEVAGDVGEMVKDIIAAVRSWKSENGMALNDEIGEIRIITDSPMVFDCQDDMIKTLKASGLSTVDQDELDERPVKVNPEYSSLGPKFRGKAKEIFDKIGGLDPEEVENGLKSSGKFTLVLEDGEGVELTEDDVKVESARLYGSTEVEIIDLEHTTVILDKN